MAAPVQREAVEHGRRHPTVRQARRTSAMTVLMMSGQGDGPALFGRRADPRDGARLAGLRQACPLGRVARRHRVSDRSVSADFSHYKCAATSSAILSLRTIAPA